MQEKYVENMMLLDIGKGDCLDTRGLYSLKVDDKNKRLTIDLNYDVFINVFGEFGLTTNDNSLCLDTINSALMLNCRSSKELFNSEEGIKYRNELVRKQLEKESKLNICDGHHDDLSELKQMIVDLQEEVKKMKEERC